MQFKPIYLICRVPQRAVSLLEHNKCVHISNSFVSNWCCKLLLSFQFLAFWIPSIFRSSRFCSLGAWQAAPPFSLSTSVICRIFTCKWKLQAGNFLTRCHGLMNESQYLPELLDASRSISILSYQNFEHGSDGTC